MGETLDRLKVFVKGQLVAGELIARVGGKHISLGRKVNGVFTPNAVGLQMIKTMPPVETSVPTLAPRNTPRPRLGLKAKVSPDG